MKWRVITLSFPRPLTTKEENLIIGAFQNAVYEPAKKNMDKWAKLLNSSQMVKLAEATKDIPLPFAPTLQAFEMMGCKYQFLSMLVNKYVVLENEGRQVYTLKYCITALSGLEVRLLAQHMHVGQFDPHRLLVKFIQGDILPSMGFGPKMGFSEVKVHSFTVDDDEKKLDIPPSSSDTSGDGGSNSACRKEALPPSPKHRGG
jgi:hypothetical protein